MLPCVGRGVQETAQAHWLLTAAGKTSSVSLPSSPKLNTTLYTITRRENLPHRRGGGWFRKGWGGVEWLEFSWDFLGSSPLGCKSSLFETCWLTVSAGRYQQLCTITPKHTSSVSFPSTVKSWSCSGNPDGAQLFCCQFLLQCLDLWKA